MTEHFQQLFPLMFQLGKHHEAAEAAEILASLMPKRSCDMSAGAQVLKVCAVLAERQTSMPVSERNALKNRYIERARQLHREAVRQSTGDPDLQDMLAWQLATAQEDWLRNPDEAVALAQQAVAHRPMEAGFWTTLGLSRYRAGDDEGAIKALTEAIRLGHGGTPRDWLYLALTHHRLRHTQEARTWYERAVTETRAPSDKELTQLRAEADAVFARRPVSD
jgi:tetratricopeptide (TPR) repeat protein